MDYYAKPDQSRRTIGECGKVCFDKKNAQTKRNWLIKNGNEKFLRIYSCPTCKCWHLTKTKKFDR